MFMYCWAVGNNLESAHTYYRRGIFDETDYTSWRQAACDFRKQPRCARFWEDNRAMFNTQFVSEVDKRCSTD